MNLIQIENNIKNLVQQIDKENFIYDLLAAYNLPKASVSRLQKGNLNLSKHPGEISWKKKLLFKEEFSKDLHLTISSLKEDIKHHQRFVIVTDYETLLAVDTQTKDQIDIPIRELPKYYDFFLPWAGMEKATHAAENPADVKAAEKMARLFDAIKKDNPENSKDFNRSLNIFFARILFCYFAEDTDIFEDDQFSHAIQSHTRSDGSDLAAYLDRLFWVLNAPAEQRGDIPHYLNAFPYVNGGLFREPIQCPQFSAKSRQLLIDSGDSNDWSAINPDIFGSMFQAVIDPEHRGGLGAHYTSVPNIMKVIEPLFLNDLKEAFEEAKGSPKKLKELLQRISKIKLFDPACGSGNFLIIAYKELRRLEMQILKELGGFAFSGIHLNNFYGIELDDFAHEIAKLSLWLAEHQMNVEFFHEFGRSNPTLPLQEAGQIVCGNACRLDWEKVCPKNEGDEIYIMGNPPYLGSNMHSDDQREDMRLVFMEDALDRLDYIGTWFYLSAKYIQNSEAKSAFVTTNSITQGVQVPFLWPKIYGKNVYIHFAVKSFKWTNNAKANAGVTVAIIGLSFAECDKILLYENNFIERVNSISPYLVKEVAIIVIPTTHPITGFPPLVMGNKPADNGYLILSKLEVEELVNAFPESKKYIRKFVSADDIINGKDRYCLWIDPKEENNAKSIPLIKERTDKLFKFRTDSKAKSTRDYASFDFRFRQISYKATNGIVVPRVSSERREYIPLAYVDCNTIVSDATNIIYDANPSLFSILTSKFHVVWVKTVGGKLRDDIRYSSSICYNTFPFPPISTQRKEELTQCTFRILEEREKHSEKTLAELYDPDKMPQGLREAHRLNDEAVERCYRSTPFKSDEERLEYLFKLYEKMIAEEKEKGTLFEGEKKGKRKN